MKIHAPNSSPVDITVPFAYGGTEGISFTEKVRNQIESGPYGAVLEVPWDVSSGEIPAPLVVRLPGYLSDDIPGGVDLKGDMLWTNLPSSLVATTYSQPSFSHTYNDSIYSSIGLQGSGILTTYNIETTSFDSVFPFYVLGFPFDRKNSILVSGLTGTVNGVDLSTLMQQSKLLDFEGGYTDHPSLGFTSGYNSNNQSAIIGYVRLEATPGQENVYISGSDITGTITFKGPSAFIVIEDGLPNGAVGRISLFSGDAYTRYAVGDDITISYANAIDDIGDGGLNLFNGKTVTITHMSLYTAEDLTGLDGVTSDNTRTDIHFSSIPDLSALDAEFIHADIVLTVGSPTIPQPTSTIPSPGIGETRLCNILRNGATDEDILYRLGIDAANGIDSEATYKTLSGDNPVQIAEGLLADITAEAWGTNGLISSAAQITTTKTCIFAATLNTITAIGLSTSGLEPGMEIEIVGSTYNDKRFYIESIVEGSSDILTVNPNIYTGVNSITSESGVSVVITAGAFDIVNIPPNPDHSEMILSGYVYSDKLTINKFNNDVFTGTSGNMNITTKEIDFGDLSTKINILGIYIGHNADNNNIKVQYRSDHGGWTTVYYDSNASTTYIHKYPLRLRNLRVFQVRIKATSAISGYELNDISIVYREKSIR